MWSWIRRQPLARQTLIGVVLICMVAAVGLSTALSFRTRSIALEESRREMTTQSDLISRTLEYSQEIMKQEASQALDRFVASLPPPHLAGHTVQLGGVARPALMFGDDIPGTGNQKFLLAHKSHNPQEDVAFLLRDGGKLYRATTLLKDSTGTYRDGSEITDAYAADILAGKPHIGTIQRAGKMYALAVKPLRDARGEVIGAISVRVDVAENINSLMAKLSSITIGRTGYPYILAEEIGDIKEPYFFMHPTLQGKPLSAVDAKTRSVLQPILDRKTGDMTYLWDVEGETKLKLAVFHEIPELHWIVVASAAEEEFTRPYDSIRQLLIGGLIGTVVLLIIALSWLTRWQTRPLKAVADSLSQMGRGDLTFDIETQPNSHNEFDLLAQRTNETRDAMKALVGTIRSTATEVSSATSGASAALQQLAGGMQGLASNAAEVSSNIEELSASVENIADSSNATYQRVTHAVSSVEQGKRVVLDVVESMRVIEGRVQSSLSEVEALTEHSHKIEAVVATIGAIAGQTNLLALNAAIEAARAGEVGRGFAVVADEVRKLAEQSAHSANEIGGILGRVTSGVSAVSSSISEVVNETNRGTQSSKAAGVALEEIETMTRDIAVTVTAIADATREQATATQAMARELSAAAQAIEETDNVTRNVSQSAAKLHEETLSLTREVGHFRI